MAASAQVTGLVYADLEHFEDDGLRRKREVYERYGVAEYCYVDRDADRIEVYRLCDGRYPAPLLLGRDDTLTTPLLPGFSVPVAGVIDGV